MFSKAHQDTKEGNVIGAGKQSTDTLVHKRPICTCQTSSPESLLSETTVKIRKSQANPYRGLQHFKIRNIAEKYGKPSTCSGPSSTTDAVLDSCNNLKSNAISIQRLKTNESKQPEKYFALETTCDYDTSLNVYHQTKNLYAPNSFRKTRNRHNLSYNYNRRFRNSVVTISNFYLFELQSVFNYLVVIFIVCQLLNLGTLSGVSCFKSQSGFSYKLSKYQLPPYAPPSYSLHGPRKFSSNARSDSEIQEKNTDGTHSKGPNTLPLYEPHYSKVSHFSEGKLILKIYCFLEA